MELMKQIPVHILWKPGKAVGTDAAQLHRSTILSSKLGTVDAERRKRSGFRRSTCFGRNDKEIYQQKNNYKNNRPFVKQGYFPGFIQDERHIQTSQKGRIILLRIYMQW